MSPSGPRWPRPGSTPTEPQPGTFVLELPGERKLATPVRLVVGDHALAVHAFVCRNPDENHEAVYRWLLSRNLRLYGVGVRDRPQR